MKSLSTLFIICLLGCIYSSHGQASGETNKSQAESKTEKSETGKQMNLLDEQTKMFGDIFELAGAEEDNPFDGAEDYAELIEKMDLSEEQKEMLREQYKVYDLSLDPTKKDSLKIAVSKMLENAMEKSQNHPNN